MHRLAALLVPALLLAAPLVAAPPGGGRESGAAALPLLQRDGRDAFLMGVNYVHSRNWLTSIDRWDPATTEKDLAALHSIGVGTVRWFPLWPYLQPRPDEVNEASLRRVAEMAALAARNGVDVQVAALTGWMSGYTFLPRWAYGELFTDPRIVAGEERLVRSLAARLRGRPGVQGYDFGNEMNVLVDFMKLKATPDDVAAWMPRIYRAFKEGDPERPVTNGVGTGFTAHFESRAVARSCDFMSVHSYPYFHRTSRLDPPLGQRTTYAVDYMVQWAAMEGRPVLVQETGATEESSPADEVARYLRVTAMSAWAEGAAGYFWWNSHDIDRAFRLPREGVYLEYSVAGSTGDLGPSESRMGLLDGENRPKAAGREFARCARWISGLGVGWRDELPAVYVVVPPSADFARTMIDAITPFVLVKQAHARPRLLRDGEPVPGDAAAVVVPGFALTPAGRAAVGRYLEAGGTVYQSWAKDFGEAVRLTGRETPSGPARAWATGRLGRLGGEQEVRLPDMPVREIEAGPGAEELARLVRGDEDPLEWSFGRPLFVRAPVGRGRYFYLAGRLEPALARVYDPWDRDQSSQLYAALLPEGEVSLDDPLVELFHKTRGHEEIVGLISHTPREREATLRLRRPARLVDSFGGEEVGAGEEVSLRLGPGDVRVLRVERTTSR